MGNLTGRIGSSQEVFKSHGSDRIRSRRVQNLAGRVGFGQGFWEISRVESGRIRKDSDMHGSGSGHPDPIRPVGRDPTRETVKNPGYESLERATIRPDRTGRPLFIGR